MLIDLLIAVVFLAVVALIISFIPMDARIKQVVWIIVIVVFAIWVLRTLFGLL